MIGLQGGIVLLACFSQHESRRFLKPKLEEVDRLWSFGALLPRSSPRTLSTLSRFCLDNAAVAVFVVAIQYVIEFVSVMEG